MTPCACWSGVAVLSCSTRADRGCLTDRRAASYMQADVAQALRCTHVFNVFKKITCRRLGVQVGRPRRAWAGKQAGTQSGCRAQTCWVSAESTREGGMGLTVTA